MNKLTFNGLQTDKRHGYRKKLATSKKRASEHLFALPIHKTVHYIIQFDVRARHVNSNSRFMGLEMDL
jgi:hypothetical protein